MGLPETGTYTSDDGVYKIQVTGSDASSGGVNGTYSAASSPVGALNISGKIGTFSWVRNKELGKDGVAPFMIRFRNVQRPSDRVYAITDIWVGGYEKDNSMLLTGSRGYVTELGEIWSISLGTKKFTK